MLQNSMAERKAVVATIIETDKAEPMCDMKNVAIIGTSLDVAKGRSNKNSDFLSQVWTQEEKENSESEPLSHSDNMLAGVDGSNHPDPIITVEPASRMGLLKKDLVSVNPITATVIIIVVLNSRDEQNENKRSHPKNMRQNEAQRVSTYGSNVQAQLGHDLSAPSAQKITTENVKKSSTNDKKIDEKVRTTYKYKTLNTTFGGKKLYNQTFSIQKFYTTKIFLFLHRPTKSFFS